MQLQIVLWGNTSPAVVKMCCQTAKLLMVCFQQKVNGELWIKMITEHNGLYTGLYSVCHTQRFMLFWVTVSPVSPTHTYNHFLPYFFINGEDA